MTTRDRLIIVAVALMAALGGFWFLALAPKHKEAAALQVQTDAATRKLSDAQQLAARARQAKAGYADDYAEVATLGKAVPQSDALPSLLYQLQSAAHNARIDFRSLNVSGSGAPAAAAATPAAATAAGATSGATAAPSSTSTTTPATGSTATATQAATAALPPGASVGAAGFPTMPFSFVFNGSYFDLERFLDDVQGFVRVKGQRVSVTGRLLSVDAFSLTAGPGGFPRVKASMTATAYVLSPNDVAPTATSGTTSAGAAATPPPTSSMVQR
jgi:Tfp pilus assembly protein PilO